MNDEFRRLCVLKVDPETALKLAEGDLAVGAGQFSVKAFRWMVRGGAMAFSPAGFPHSMAEAMGS